MFPFDALEGSITGSGQPVTSGGAGEQDADAPDDGSKLVYRTIRGGAQQVWERNVADGHERLLVRGDQWWRTRPRWSSDGTRISYMRRRNNPGSRAAVGSVVVLTVDRGEERLVTSQNGPQVIPSDWSADGRWVLGGCPQLSTRTVGTCLVAVSETAPGSASIRVLTTNPTLNLFEQRFSPDQRWISFIAVNAADAGASTLFVMPAGGGPWKVVTDGASYDDKPHWARRPHDLLRFAAQRRTQCLGAALRRGNRDADRRDIPGHVVQQPAPDDLGAAVADADRRHEYAAVPADHRDAERAVDAG
jgi:dipeptidyl aminopeptidase/acylaminoacyl peptidase